MATRAITEQAKANLAQTTANAFKMYNKDHGTAWDMGSNWTNEGKAFETFINKYLFPTIRTTDLINVDLTNRFDWLAKEIAFIGQLSQEYVIKDSIPVDLNLSKPATLMLERNYPQMITKIYNEGVVRKRKFTLNNNDTRLNWQTIGDGVSYAFGVYRKTISDINYSEELDVKAMLVDYANTYATDVETVANADALFNKVFEKFLDFQDSSAIHNEASLASGGAIGRYTTRTNLEKIMILTTNSMKTFLLNSRIANTFQTAGIDVSKRIISFYDLGGIWRLTANVTISNDATVSAFQAMGDYQISKGDTLPKDTVIPFDISTLTEFTGKVTEIKPDAEQWAYVFDVDKIRYARNTQDMWKEPFTNPEFDETTHWLHYYSQKNMSPFYNSCVIKVTTAP